MLTLRPAEWPKDEEALAVLDTSFMTERIYRVVQEEWAFRLVEETVTPPLRKQYPFAPSDPAERRDWDFAVIVEENSLLAGFAAAQHAEWNRRVILWHLYVQPAFRGQGVGRRLLEAADDFARSVQARCLWLETQNVNYPAIQFYQRCGFQLCGLDASLYNPAGADTDEQETALFFSRPILI